MRLVNPYTGCVVDAPEGVAARLVAQGFKPEKQPRKRTTTRKTTTKAAAAKTTAAAKKAEAADAEKDRKSVV